MVESEYKIQLRSIKRNGVLSEVTIECIDYHTFRALNSAVRQVLEREERYANKNNEQED